MAKVSTRDQMGDIRELVVAMAKCGDGRPVAEVAQAGLDLALGLWALDPDITREMATEVILAQIADRIRPSN